MFFRFTDFDYILTIGGNMAAPLAAAGALVKKYAKKKLMKLAKKYGPPVAGALLIAIIGSLIALASFFTVFTGGSSCGSGGTDLAILATNGPVNVGDKVPNPLRSGGTITITEEMMGNAQAIVRAGINYKPTRIPDRGIVIAIATTFPESGLINLKGGDRDSVGLFQQRPSQGWGSVQQILDPTFAANSFYRAMLAIPNWETRPPGDVAADVQRPAAQYRYKYALFVPIAAGLVTSILQAMGQSGPAINASVDENTVPSSFSLASANAAENSTLLALVTRMHEVFVPPPSTEAPAVSAAPGGDCAQLAGFDAINATGSEPGPNGTTVPIAEVPGIGKINATIAGQVTAMLAAARGDGVNLTGSAYRSHARQIQLRTINGCPDVWTASPSSCRVPTAIPGRSQHEVGLAIDFENCSYRSSACYIWLSGNADRFGLRNLPSEPWHWSTTGR